MPTVLAVQSHVVHGYVGNKASTFPLQLRGWDVDALNSVQLSNHTGYGSTSGTRTTPEEIKDIYNGLSLLNFEYDALLTGYVPSAQGVQAVVDLGVDLVRRFPEAIWLLDPVMGDEGRLYVSKDVIPVYQNALRLGKVTLTTPNGFEAEILTGVTLDSREAVHKALGILHNDFGVPNVVLSSVQLDGKLYAVGSTAGEPPFIYELDKIEGYFTGTGDLFSALMLDNYHRCINDKKPGALARAVAATLKTVHGVLMGTHEYARQNNGGPGVIGDPTTMKFIELRLIAHRKVLEVVHSDLPGPSLL